MLRTAVSTALLAVCCLGTAVAQKANPGGGIVQLSDNPTFTLSVNAGGPAMAGFQDDAFFGPGEIWDGGGGGAPFEGTVYRTQRFSSGESVTFSAPVPPGTYLVQLLFNEMYHNSAGGRVMDVSVEGVTVAKDFDVVAANGGRSGVGHTLTVLGVDPARSGDTGTLDVVVSRVRDNPVLNAVRIICVSDHGCGAGGDAPKAAQAGAALGARPSILINAAGPALTQNGKTFGADVHFNGGRKGKESKRGNGLQESFIGTIHETVRWGRSFRYAIPVDPGPVVVALYFSEGFHSRAGRRVFHVDIEGQRVLENFDVLAETGGDINGKIVKRFASIDPAASGEAGLLEIDFSTVRDNAAIQAIEILPCPPGSPCTVEAAGAVVAQDAGAGAAVAKADQGADAVSPNAEPGPAEPLSLAINVAGPALTQDGVSFQADAHYKGGKESRDSAEGNGVQAPFTGTVYETVRFGKKFAYAIPVGKGPVDLALHFGETTQTRTGVRVFHVWVEDERVFEKFDILEETGGDINGKIVKRLEAIDPAKSGDPETLDIRFTTRRRNAVLSAIEVSRCGDEAACAAAKAERAKVAAAAQKQALVAQAAQDAADGKRWRGQWERRSRSRVRVGGTVIAQYQTITLIHRATITDAGVLAQLGLAMGTCTIAFEPGPRPEEMSYVTDDCPERNKLADFKLAAKGADGLTLSLTAGGRPWSVDLPKIVWPTEAATVPPKDTPMDLAGIALGKTVAETKAAIEAAFDPADPDKIWLVRSERGSTVWEYRSKLRGGSGVPQEHFAIIGLNEREDAPPVALVRTWSPARDARPTFANLQAALLGKYGAVSKTFTNKGQHVLSHRAFAPDGARLSDACTGAERRSINVRQQTVRPLGLGQLTLSLRANCGYVLGAEYRGTSKKPNDLVDFVRFTVLNNGIANDGAWTRLRDRAEADYKRFFERIAATKEREEAEQDRRKAVEPKL